MRGADPTPDPQHAELEALLGIERVESLVAAASQPEARPLRQALRALVADVDRRAGETASTLDAGESERIDHELRLAQRVQRSLVLIADSNLEGWEIASDYRPARQIGGDFFDAYPILEGGKSRRLGFVIADVSGKGISAALLMAFVRPIMRAALDRTGRPGEALERTNRILVDERRTGLFVTAVCGVLDLESGRLVVANAGHELPLLVPGDGSPIRKIPGSGPLLGVFGRLDLDEVAVELRQDDALVLYTDGITDATSAAGERYGERRLLRVVRRIRDRPTTEVSSGIIGSVARFQGDSPAVDDLALLIIRRRG